MCADSQYIFLHKNYNEGVTQAMEVERSNCAERPVSNQCTSHHNMEHLLSFSVILMVAVLMERTTLASKVLSLKLNASISTRSVSSKVVTFTHCCLMV